MKRNLLNLTVYNMRLEADQFIDFASFDSHKNLKECIYRGIDHYKKELEKAQK